MRVDSNHHLFDSIDKIANKKANKNTSNIESNIDSKARTQGTNTKKDSTPHTQIIDSTQNLKNTNASVDSKSHKQSTNSTQGTNNIDSMNLQNTNANVDSINSQSINTTANSTQNSQSTNPTIDSIQNTNLHGQNATKILNANTTPETQQIPNTHNIESKQHNLTTQNIESKHNIESNANTKADIAFDRRWILALFGTALGAGILFLPIAAGRGGFWPVVVMTLIAFPMAFLSHRAFSRFTLGVRHPDSDITHAAEEYWGRRASFVLTILYFFVIYPVVLAYGVGITNTFGNFLIYQLDVKSFYIESSGEKALLPHIRLALAFVLVSAMMAIMLLKEEWVTRVCTALVYPLCFVLAGFSLYLIGFWKLDSISYVPNAKDFLIIVYLALPVIVFSFDFSPVVSTFSVSVKRRYAACGDAFVDKKASSIIFKTTLMLLIFTMFFTFSCILCLDSKDFAMAREANIPILSYFANTFASDSSDISYYIFSYAAPLVAFLAIITSFFGHYFGAYEGLTGIIRKASKMIGIAPNMRKIHIFNTIFLYITIVIFSYFNPSILDFIENLSGPIIAIMLLLMPIYAIYSIAALKHYQNKLLDLFVFVVGVITVSCIVYNSYVNIFG